MRRPRAELGTYATPRERAKLGAYTTPRGRSEFARAAPHPALRPHVGEYVGFVERYDGAMRRREVPSTQVALILNLGPPLWIGGPASAPDGPGPHGSFLAGLDDAYAVTEYQDYSAGIEVNFTPLGARLAFGLPMHELSKRVTTLEDVLGAEAELLLERLDGLPTWDERFDVLDALLLARFAAARRPPPTEVAWALHRLESADGDVRVGALADELGWSRKRLIAGFYEHVGVPPKTLGRILRFQRVITGLDAPGERTWADVAYDCGYYDQAHFNREFRALAGTTPTEYVASRLGAGLGVLADPGVS